MSHFRDLDVLVAGGGPAGVAAAVMAARQGAKTLLVERYGRLGGADVNNLVHPLMGGVRSPLVEELSQRFAKIGNDYELLDLVYADWLTEAGAEILLHAWVVEPIRQDRAVRGLRVLTKQGLLDLGAHVVVDATGDADVAFRAGAAFEKGRPQDGLMQPVSIMYRLGGVDKTIGLLCGSEEQATKVHVPEGTWHEVVHAGQARGELPATIGVIRVYEAPHPGERIVNATQVNRVDGTNVLDLTRAELEARRQALVVTDLLRKHAPGYEKCYIAQMPQSVGVRETRRFLGVEYLTRQDVVTGRKWDTAIVRDAFFPVDIHNPDGAGQAEGLQAAQVRHYDIPYGCLVPREVDGLLLAGRCISGSHDAHASYRVQRIVMAIGAAAGAAAALAARDRIEPRAVPVRDIQALVGISTLPHAES